MEARRVQLVLRDELADSFRRYQSARNQVEHFQKSILLDAKENLQLVSRGQEQGEFSLFQVLTARQTYSRSSLAYVESLAELHKVVVEIKGLQLTGGLNPATLGAAIQTQGSQRQQGLLNQLQEGGHTAAATRRRAEHRAVSFDLRHAGASGRLTPPAHLAGPRAHLAGPPCGARKPPACQRRRGTARKKPATLAAGGLGDVIPALLCQNQFIAPR